MSKVLVTEEYLQDIADAIREQNGGSDTYTPAQMGDAIRTISGGKHSYSTTEHVVGTWIDERDVYEKVIDFGYLPNANTKEVSHGITNADIFIEVKLVCADSNGVAFTAPFAASPNNNDNSHAVTFVVDGSVVRVGTGMDRTGFYGYAILRYVKTAS